MLDFNDAMSGQVSRRVTRSMTKAAVRTVNAPKRVEVDEVSEDNVHVPTQSSSYKISAATEVSIQILTRRVDELYESLAKHKEDAHLMERDLRSELAKMSRAYAEIADEVLSDNKPKAPPAAKVKPAAFISGVAVHDDKTSVHDDETAKTSVHGDETTLDGATTASHDAKAAGHDDETPKAAAKVVEAAKVKTADAKSKAAAAKSKAAPESTTVRRSARISAKATANSTSEGLYGDAGDCECSGDESPPTVARHESMYQPYIDPENGFHATLHKTIIYITSLSEPTHEILDQNDIALFLPENSLCYPSASNFVDRVSDRHAEVIRFLIRLYDGVSAYARERQVSPDLIYSEGLDTIDRLAELKQPRI
jgi:hypothetical protein